MAEPSKVIHVRNVGSDATEQDVQLLAQNFAVAPKVLLMRQKNQAFLELPDVAAAINLVNFFTTVQPTVRGRNVYIQFSSHKELTTHDNGAKHAEGAPNCIILVTVHNALYPINVDVLHQVFSPHGFVEKIVTFQKAAGLQGLVQYQNLQSAVNAKTTLQGRNIYDGCCTLDIQFSNLQELQVSFNNDKTRDYTNTQLPDGGRQGGAGGAGASLFGEGGSSFGVGGGGRAGYGGAPQGVAGGIGHYQGGGGGGMSPAALSTIFGGHLPPGVTGTNDRATLLVTNINNEQLDVDKLFNLFSNYGNVVRIKFLYQKPDHALIQMAEGLQAELAAAFLRGATLFGKRLEVNFSKYPTISPSQDAKDFSTSNLNRFNRNAHKNYRHCCAPTRMVHVSSLPTEITAEEVVEHLSGFGTILGSKLFEKEGKKQVLVQFDSESAATEALVSKHATPIKGSHIRLAFSKSLNL